MSDSITGLRRQIDSATDLQGVVRTMKAIAASRISLLEHAVQALADYERTVALGLGASLRALGPAAASAQPPARAPVRAVVFGSDQGLVGEFNEAVAELACSRLVGLPLPPRVWAVGERVQAQLADAGLAVQATWAVPESVQTIAPLVAQVLLASQRPARRGAGQGGVQAGGRGAADPSSDPGGDYSGDRMGDRMGDPTGAITDEAVADGELLLFYNSPLVGARHAPLSLRLLPLDDQWRRTQLARHWPTSHSPELVGGHEATLSALVGEYLFVSLYRACALSMASENASRLSAMERADQNIDSLLETLRSGFHRQRQNRIDEELFDVIAGFEALR